MFYTYIISNNDGIFYKGSTSDFKKRLEQHNAGLNHYTRGRGPWRPVFLQAFETRKEAEALEKRLKRCNKTYLNWLVKQPVNILDR
jgi:putative endonuclease